jgi:DnaK suppressor protein
MITLETIRSDCLTTVQTSPFQIQLLAQRTALLAQIAEQRGGVISRAEAANDHFGKPEDSPAEVTTARDFEFAMGEHEIAALGAIDAALQRIADGSYGQCTDCGVTIPANRLQAAPEASRCIHCQEKAERTA